MRKKVIEQKTPRAPSPCPTGLTGQKVLPSLVLQTRGRVGAHHPGTSPASRDQISGSTAVATSATQLKSLDHPLPPCPAHGGRVPLPQASGLSLDLGFRSGAGKKSGAGLLGPRAGTVTHLGQRQALELQAESWLARAGSGSCQGLRQASGCAQTCPLCFMLVSSPRHSGEGRAQPSRSQLKPLAAHPQQGEREEPVG